MLSKRCESTEVDRRTLLHVHSGTHWSIRSDTNQVVEIQIETSTKMYTPFLIPNLLLIKFNLLRCIHHFNTEFTVKVE